MKLRNVLGAMPFLVLIACDSNPSPDPFSNFNDDGGAAPASSAGASSGGDTAGASVSGGVSGGAPSAAGAAGFVAAGGLGSVAGDGGAAAGGASGSAGATSIAGAGGASGSAGAAGAGAAAAAHPYGSHQFKYSAGSIMPSGAQATLDKATADVYDGWKAAYLKTGCGGYYVDGGQLDGDPGIFAVSEGEGYGMVIVPLMAGHDPQAQTIFDGLYNVFRKVPSINTPDLPGWELMNNSAGMCTSTTTTTDTFDDSATDGDLDTAFGLLLADAQWGSAGAINYLAEAKKVILAIKTNDLNPTSKLLLLGDWANIKASYYATRYADTPGPYSDPAAPKGSAEPHPRYYWGSRPSDYMMDHLRAFQGRTSDGSWSAVIDAHYALMASMQQKYSPKTGLIPDFVADTDTAAAPAKGYYLEASTDSSWGYNSCRVPWHLGTDFVVSGEPRAKATLALLNTWITGVTKGDPAKIVDGYTLAGKATGTAPVLEFVAPFGVAAMADAKNQAWLDAVWKFTVAQKKQNYFGDTVKMLSMLVMSNNWFQP